MGIGIGGGCEKGRKERTCSIVYPRVLRVQLASGLLNYLHGAPPLLIRPSPLRFSGSDSGHPSATLPPHYPSHYHISYPVASIRRVGQHFWLAPFASYRILHHSCTGGRTLFPSVHFSQQNRPFNLIFGSCLFSGPHLIPTLISSACLLGSSAAHAIGFKSTVGCHQTRHHLPAVKNHSVDDCYSQRG